MGLIVFFITSIFLFPAFLSNSTSSNYFLAFFLSEGSFILDNIVFFILCFIILTIYIFKRTKYSPHYNFIKKLLFTFYQLFQLTILGLLFAFTSLYIIAFLQLNIFSIIINLNPKSIGVITDKIGIVNYLKTNSIAPKIVVTDKSQSKELSALAIASTGDTNYYGKYVLPSFPVFLSVPVKKSSSGIYLLDSTMVISRVDTGDVQALSPYIGYLFIKSYFANRPIASYPQVNIMDKNEYIKYRTNESYKSYKKINEELAKIKDETSSISAAIETGNSNVTSSENTVLKADLDRTVQYKKCVAASSKEACSSLLDQLNKASQEDNNNLKKNSAQIANYKNQLAVYAFYEKFFKLQLDAVATSKEGLPHELGVFEPKNTIKITLTSSNPHAISDYLETLVHEYYHYASYTKGKILADGFFEEGLTEYFARQTIKDTLNTSTNLGYPVQVKIIAQMTKLIPETEFADIYFTKDQARLEATLNRVYGENFYNKTRLLFSTLQYTTTKDQMLSLGNNIMKLIGGQPMQEKDIYSSSSKL